MFETAYVELKKSKKNEVIILLLPNAREKEMNKIFNNLVHLHGEGIKIKGSEIVEIAEKGLKALLAESVKLGHETPEKLMGQDENYFKKLKQLGNNLKIKFIMCLQEDLSATEEKIESKNQLNSLFSVVGYGWGFNFSLT